MKISIRNFKSIGELIDYELLPLTILSGINSSGKSSFIQLLLLIKQTIDINSSKFQLYLDGDLYQVKDFKDIIKDKNFDNKLKISFDFSKEEFKKIGKSEIDIFDSFGDYNCIVDLQYDFEKSKECISLFSVKLILPEGAKEQFIHFKSTNGQYQIETNTAIFGRDLFYEKLKINDISFSGIFPASYNWSKFDETIGKDVTGKGVASIDGVKSVIEDFFKNISYVGPIREQPKDQYTIRGLSEYVGPKGEYVAEVLQKHAKDKISYNVLVEKEDGVAFKEVTGYLIDAVKYWMCDVFKIGKDVFVDKRNDYNTILLLNESGLTTTIKHVGFGVSQILPIIVEGLRLPANGTLILEQPEIHLHPKLQSSLFDFLNSLTAQGKSVIVETHSDHFITRMRRRIAEDTQEDINSKSKLSFIEVEKHQLMFRDIEIDNYGIADFYPEDFIERSNIELKAIVKAQMNKRLNK